MTEIERIESIRKFYKMNKKSFSEILGYSYAQNYTKYLSGDRPLSMKSIKALKDYDKSLDINWIVIGEGEMFIPQDTTPVKNKDLEELTEIINTLEKSNEESKKRGETIDKYIAMLEDKIEELEKEVKKKKYNK
jgi:hypothetical protein